MSKFLKFIVNLFLILAIVVTAGIIVPPLLGVNTTIVDTASMDTNLPLGSVTYSRDKAVKDLAAGDEILKESGSATYAYIIQEGDAATGEFTVASATELGASSESIILRNTVSEVVLTIPYIGFVVVAMQSLEGRIIVALVILFIIILFILSELWKKRDDDDEDDDDMISQGDQGNLQAASANKSVDAVKPVIYNEETAAGYSENVTDHRGYGTVSQDTASIAAAMIGLQAIGGKEQEAYVAEKTAAGFNQATGVFPAEQPAAGYNQTSGEFTAERDTAEYKQMSGDFTAEQDTAEYKQMSGDFTAERDTAEYKQMSGDFTAERDTAEYKQMSGDFTAERDTAEYKQMSGDFTAERNTAEYKQMSGDFTAEQKAARVRQAAASEAAGDTKVFTGSMVSQIAAPGVGSGRYKAGAGDGNVAEAAAESQKEDAISEALIAESEKAAASWNNTSRENTSFKESQEPKSLWSWTDEPFENELEGDSWNLTAGHPANAAEYPERFAPVERMTRQEIFEQVKAGGNDPKVQRDDVTGIDIIDYSDLL